MYLTIYVLVTELHLVQCHLKVMSEDILRHPEMLGGPGVVVQIDESLLSRAKPALNGVARQAPAQWVFGMVDSNGRAHIQLVPDRSGDTLLAVVRAHVLPGSEVRAL